jgi:hypothetical protein
MLTGNSKLVQPLHGNVSKMAGRNGPVGECAWSPAASESSRARKDRLTTSLAVIASAGANSIESAPRHAPASDSVTPLARQLMFPGYSMYVTEIETRSTGVTTGSGSGGVEPHAQASAEEFSLVDAGSETLTFLEYMDILKATNAQHLRSLAANGDRIELLKSNFKALKVTVSNLRVRTRELVDIEACLREHLGAGMAFSIGRGTSGKKRELQESEERFKSALSPLQEDAVSALREDCAALARLHVCSLTVQPNASGAIEFSWHPAPKKIADRDGRGTLTAGAHAPQPPLAVAKRGLHDGALTPSTGSVRAWAHSACARGLATASPILTKALREAAPDALSAACNIGEGMPVCGQVQKPIAIALGNLKQKVGGMLLELWEEKWMPTAKGVIAAEEQGAYLRALESRSDIGLTVMNAIFEPSTGDLLKLEGCVNMVRPNHLSSWRLENTRCAEAGGRNFPSPPGTCVDLLFASAFARLIYA